MNEQYKDLKLSDHKKQAMIHAIKMEQPQHYRKSYAGFVSLLFAGLAVLFVLIVGSDSTSQQQVNSSSNLFIKMKEEIFNLKTIIYWSISVLFLMLAYVQFLLLAIRPERLKEYRLFRNAHDALGTKKMTWIIAIPFLWMIIETISIIVFPHELLLQFFVVLLLWVNVVLLQFKIVKSKRRATCPHCGVELTNKEILLNKNCGVCGNGRMRIVNNNFKENFIATGGGTTVLLFPFFDISLILMLAYALLYILFTCFFVSPYLYDFSKESEIPPPLW